LVPNPARKTEMEFVNNLMRVGREVTVEMLCDAMMFFS